MASPASFGKRLYVKFEVDDMDISDPKSVQPKGREERAAVQEMKEFWESSLRHTQA